jgi:hypothetical protein
MNCEIELDEVEGMYRAVLTDAIRDLGFGSPGEFRRVKAWTSEPSFSVCCTLAGWEEVWVRDCLKSIISIDGGVRKPIVIECLEIMRGVSRLSTTSTLDVNGASGFGHEGARLDEYDLKYIGSPVGALSAASKAMHLKRRGGGDATKQQ